jgi:hypothetical protein
MISTPQEITASWLEEKLAPSGFGGTIASLEVTPADTLGKGEAYYLHPAYRKKTAAPQKFFLKLLSNEKIVWFHTEMAVEMENPPLLPIYAAAFDPDAGRGYLLMADLSDSHSQTEWPLPPSLADCREAVGVLAHFHAHWWQHPRLETDLAGWVAERRWQTRLLETAGRIEDFLGFLGDRISQDRRRVYRRLAEGWPALVASRQANRPLTITHCDAHAWNFLFPHDHETGRTVLFDWTNWDISTAADDLAYFIGLHWYPERRHQYELPLLQEYHQRLAGCGVQDYSWEECRQDYRRSVLRAMLIPAWQWKVGISPRIWWPHLERGLLAFEDLGCGELLKNNQ